MVTFEIFNTQHTPRVLSLLLLSKKEDKWKGLVLKTIDDPLAFWGAEQTSWLHGSFSTTSQNSTTIMFLCALSFAEKYLLSFQSCVIYLKFT